MSIAVSNPPVRLTTRVLATRQFSTTGFELTLERHGIAFRAGQLLNIRVSDLLEGRDYTICSGERDEHLQILFRLIPSGKLTPQLAALKTGDALEISGPYGEFVLRDPSRRIFFIATGTGVAPCRAYIRTNANLPVTLLHGVRNEEDLFYSKEFASLNYRPCISGGSTKFFNGRVTDLAATFELPVDAHYYLCGANEMFYDIRDVLAARGVPPANVFTEAYYYRADD